MSYPVYYVEAGDTLPVLFDSFDSDGASVTLTGLAATDIEIYKDGGTTQRSSDAGYTLLDTDGIDFDSLTGIHGFSIDLSDNTDAGFYAVGSWYHVVVSSVTIDSQTVSFIACAFRILSTTRGMSGTALPDAAADAAGGLPISDAGGLDLDAQIGTDIDAILVDTGTTLQDELDGIQADTEDLQTQIGTAGDGLTAVPWNASWDAEVQSEVDDALVANNLDHLMKTATAGTDMTTEVADNTVMSRVLANGDTSAFDPSTDGLQPIRDHIGDGTNLTEAGGDGDHLTEAGGTGDQLSAIPWNANWDAEVQSEVTDGLNAYDPPTHAELISEINDVQTDIAGLNDPTAASIADAVWDELSTGHTDAGKAGQQMWSDVDAILADTNELQTDDIPSSLTTIESKIDTVDTNVDAVLVDTGTDIPASLTTIDANVDAILVDTGTTLPATLTSIEGKVDTVDGVADAILVDTDTTIPGLITALNDITVADVLTTAMTESYAADGAAPTLAQAIFAIQQFLQERAVSNTTVTVKKLDGSTSAMTFTLNDATTPTSITRSG